MIKDFDVITEFFRAELLLPGEDDELHALICSMYRHRHSIYCYNRAGRCKFRYNTTMIGPDTCIEEGMNRMMYRRRAEILKFVPYNPTLMKKYRSHINM